jgi:hypothetical protein
LHLIHWKHQSGVSLVSHGRGAHMVELPGEDERTPARPAPSSDGFLVNYWYGLSEDLHWSSCWQRTAKPMMGLPRSSTQTIQQVINQPTYLHLAQSVQRMLPGRQDLCGQATRMPQFAKCTVCCCFASVHQETTPSPFLIPAQRGEQSNTPTVLATECLKHRRCGLSLEL